jgi:hypothetical protein
VCVYCEARTDTGVCNERRATRMTKERKPEKREIGLDPRDRSVFAAAAGSGVLPEPRGFPQAILTPP